MKFKEPKENVYIHCSNMDEVTKMYWRFKERDYTLPFLTDCLNVNLNKQAFFVNTKSKVISISEIDDTDMDFYMNEVEFKDLFESEEEHEMTAKEFLEIYQDYNKEHYIDIDNWLDYYTPDKIIQKFHKFSIEHKIKSVNWVVTCRIIQTKNGLKKCVYEEDMPKNQTNANNFCEEVLKKYASEHEGDYFAVTTSRCIAVRGDENE